MASLWLACGSPLIHRVVCGVHCGRTGCIVGGRLGSFTTRADGTCISTSVYLRTMRTYLSTREERETMMCCTLSANKTLYGYPTLLWLNVNVKLQVEEIAWYTQSLELRIICSSRATATATASSPVPVPVGSPICGGILTREIKPRMFQSILQTQTTEWVFSHQPRNEIAQAFTSIFISRET